MPKEFFQIKSTKKEDADGFDRSYNKIWTKRCKSAGVDIDG